MVNRAADFSLVVILLCGFEVGLKSLRCLSHVVPQTNQIPPSTGAKGLGEVPGVFCYCPQVINESVPLGLVFGSVGEEVIR
ncbi:hypothetical protein EG19_09455 [Thermoanaerobaculum aquaticum]|uniref:Uncharacterized protein n=1 Tax=Thermoanaerobaculum aquaticum TaxID=1312852 RepID=A0A062XJZ3_9BACT|nr:hypothetical protein EG19_09455 [Thermoanaerobaculum aquaticum]